DTAFIRYQFQVKATMAQEAVVLQLAPGGAQFQGLERIMIVRSNQPPRAKITYQLSGSKQSTAFSDVRAAVGWTAGANTKPPSDTRKQLTGFPETRADTAGWTVGTNTKLYSEPISEKETTDDSISGVRMVLTPTGMRAMGNIAPYRKDLLMRLSANW